MAPPFNVIHKLLIGITGIGVLVYIAGNYVPQLSMTGSFALLISCGIVAFLNINNARRKFNQKQVAISIRITELLQSLCIIGGLSTIALQETLLIKAEYNAFSTTLISFMLVYIVLYAILQIQTMTEEQKKRHQPLVFLVLSLIIFVGTFTIYISGLLGF